MPEDNVKIERGDLERLFGTPVVRGMGSYYAETIDDTRPDCTPFGSGYIPQVRPYGSLGDCLNEAILNHQRTSLNRALRIGPPLNADFDGDVYDYREKKFIRLAEKEIRDRMMSAQKLFISLFDKPETVSFRLTTLFFKEKYMTGEELNELNKVLMDDPGKLIKNLNYVIKVITKAEELGASKEHLPFFVKVLGGYLIENKNKIGTSETRNKVRNFRGIDKSAKQLVVLGSRKELYSLEGSPIKNLIKVRSFEKEMGQHWPLLVKFKNIPCLPEHRKLVHKIFSRTLHKYKDFFDGPRAGNCAQYLYRGLVYTLIYFGEELATKILQRFEKGSLGKTFPMVFSTNGYGTFNESSMPLGYATPDKPLSKKKKAWINERFNAGIGIELLLPALSNWKKLKSNGWKPESPKSHNINDFMFALKYKGVVSIELAKLASLEGIGAKKFKRIETRWLEDLGDHDTFMKLDFMVGDIRVQVLNRSDPEGLFMGTVLGNCQRPGGTGSSCAWHGAIDKRGCFLTLSRGEKMLSGSWVWLGHKGEVVLDSVELSEKTSVSHEELLRVYSDHVFKAIKEAMNVKKVYIGGRSANLDFGKGNRERGPKSPRGYSDASIVWVV